VSLTSVEEEGSPSGWERLHLWRRPSSVARRAWWRPPAARERAPPSVAARLARGGTAAARVARRAWWRPPAARERASPSAAAAWPSASERDERVGGNETGERENRVWDLDLGFQD
jgi:hypothetical protein